MTPLEIPALVPDENKFSPADSLVIIKNAMEREKHYTPYSYE